MPVSLDCTGGPAFGATGTRGCPTRDRVVGFVVDELGGKEVEVYELGGKEVEVYGLERPGG